MQKGHSLLLGAHISIAGEMHLAIERGESIGCTAIQIFTKSNRQWHAKDITKEQADAFKKAWKDSSIKNIVVHASYLINIGSANPELEQKSIEAVKLELDRCSMLNIPYLILHPGSCGTDPEESCLDRISSNINKILAHNKDCSILLETMAGQGSNVGYTFEQLAHIIKNIKHKKRVGVCFDTCHAFAAGYDFRTESAYKHMWEKFDKIIGIDKLKAIHLNDSQKDLGSCVDRHTDIGKGKIGLKAFEILLKDRKFLDIPKILETPKESLADDKRNLEVLLELL